jgi:seryl-tRNA synthetase
MLSIQFIRQNPGLVRKALENRHDSAPLDDILSLDEQRRKLLTDVESLRAQRKQESKRYGQMKTGAAAEEGKPSEELTQELANVREQIRLAEAEVETVEEQLHDLLLRVPNIPDPGVPVGNDSAENIVTRDWGTPRQFDFQPRPHWELGEALDIIDFPRGVKLSGTRFYVLKSGGARLQRALISLMLHLHTSEHGYTEIYPPFMVKRECMIGSSNLPKFADNLYHDEEDDFWFVPTAEVPLTNLHRDEILERGELPLHYAAYSACFRREKMAAGKDTRGIKRGHQFDKVELYKFTEPQNSMEELEKMVRNAEEVCRRLGLPYRIVELCTGDLGFASAKSYDIEVWAPGCQEWLEVSSCSNCTDFQARRASIRYRPEQGAKPQFVHTLNGSGLAMPRVLISVLENYQQADGSIVIPDALLPYMDGPRVISRTP